MSYKLTILEYVSCIEPFSNQPINLHTLLSPFGIRGASTQTGSILIGEFIDELCVGCDTLSVIDASIVIDLISELEALDWVENILPQDDFEELFFPEENTYDFYKALIR